EALIATNEVDGVIIGKAYYEGRLDLAKMFKLLN
ncbi:MAG: phosphoribosylformimino-5-aminoimidazole carboxamide ribotide isomerase, partial [Sulfurimonas sp.]